MKQPRVWAYVKNPDGTIVKQLISFQGMEKIKQQMTYNAEKGLYLNKKYYRYVDDKFRSETGSK